MVDLIEQALEEEYGKPAPISEPDKAVRERKRARLEPPVSDEQRMLRESFRATQSVLNANPLTAGFANEFDPLLAPESVEEHKRIELEQAKATGDFVKNAVGGGIKLIATTPTDLVALPGNIENLFDADVLPPFAEINGEEIRITPAANEASNKIASKIDEFFGMKEPETPLEFLNQYGPALATPTGVQKLVKKFPQLAGNKIVKQILNGVDIFLLPGVSGKYKATNVAANVGVPFAADQAIREFVVEEKSGEEQATVFDVMNQKSNTYDGDDLDRALNEYIDPIEAAMQELEDEDSFLNSNTGKATAAALAIVGFSGAKQAIRKRNADANLDFGENITRPDEPAGAELKVEGFTTDVASQTTRGEAIRTALLDANSTLFEKVERLASKEDASLLRAEIEKNTRAGSRARIDEIYRTGDFDGLQLTSPTTGEKFSPDSWFRAYETISPEEAAVLDRALLAGDALDSRRLAVQQAVDEGQPITVTPDGVVEGPKPSVSKLSNKELDDMLEALEEAPHLKEMRDRYKVITNAILDYRVQNGVMSRTEADLLKANRPNFMPNINPNDNKTLAQRIQRDIDSMKPESEIDRFVDQQLQLLRGRNLEEGQGLQTLVNPANALRQYMDVNLHYIHRKRAQREFIKIVDSLEEGAFGVKEVKGKRFDPSKTITVPDGEGQFRTFEVADPQMLEALKFNPIGVQGFWKRTLLDMPKRILQFNLTGMFAPLFAPTAHFYEQAGQVFSKKHFKTPSLTGFAGDPSSFFVSALGMPRGLYTRLKAEAATSIQTSLLSQRGVFSRFPETASRVSQAMFDGYQQSALHRLRREGAFNATMITEGENEILSALNRHGPDSMVGQVSRGYLGILNSIQEAYRLEYGVRNLDGKFPDKIVANEVRNITGNFAKRGIGDQMFKLPDADTRADQWKDVATKLTTDGLASADTFAQAAIPYYNIGKIVLAEKIGGSIQKNPVRFATGVTLGIGMPAAMSAYTMSTFNEEFRNAYWNDPDRHGYVILPNPLAYSEDPDTAAEFSTYDKAIRLPVPIDFAGVHSSVIEGLRASGKLSDEGSLPRSEYLAGPVNQFSRLLPADPGPSLNIALALTTGQTFEAGRFAPNGFVGFKNIETEGLTGAGEEKTLGSGIPARIDQATEEILGTTWHILLDGYMAAAKADGGQKAVDNLVKQMETQTKMRIRKPTLGQLGLQREKLSTSQNQRLWRERDIIEQIHAVYKKGISGRKSPTDIVPVPTNPRFIEAGATIEALQPVIGDLLKVDNDLKRQIEEAETRRPLGEDSIEHINELVRSRNAVLQAMIQIYAPVKDQFGIGVDELDPFASE